MHILIYIAAQNVKMINVVRKPVNLIQNLLNFWLETPAAGMSFNGPATMTTLGCRDFSAFVQTVGVDSHTAPVKGIQSTSMSSSGAIYLRGYCATYLGAQSVGLAETRRTADYQTTAFDCVSKLLERSASANPTGDNISADDKHGEVRVKCA